MSPPLYIFETDLPGGGRTRGTAGLPYDDMLRIMSFYNVSRMVLAPPGTSRLNIVLPVTTAHDSTNNRYGITPTWST